jgi:cupin fold WbuC family metalloprotein
MQVINSVLTDAICSQAKGSQRLRKNYNFHPSLDDILQRMLNALEPGTYVQPHKHENPDKVEAFIILCGRLLVLEFDDQGRMIQHAILSGSEKCYGVEIQPRVWHSIISLASGTVVYEVKNGPYSPINDKNFASWAPKEGDPDCEAFNQRLLEQCGLSNK